ncbi:phosphoenolpyruvate--protein phosphotransferase [Clostridium sp. MSJ-11]|uniref:Phosphoenolpyruvate-protein phosphotransferase n=1 Tax=Clostridium mobile TaxID=2841512 RepID=A0ABS6EEK6_9CLOT|nr:phosphoenolpyruvate--protein phosphotransferase [Clostridium mobile]MBU5483131.1 phosphoenolpyruvate--protein phosphotransferase [Clostridium mobile]
MLKGIKASSGIAIGKAFVIKEYDFKPLKIKIEDSSLEEERFNKAVEKAKKELEELIESTIKNFTENEGEIFEAHLTMLDDPELIGTVSEKILKENINAEYALKTVCDELVEIFEGIEDEYLKERIVDIKDVTKRMLRILNGQVEEGVNNIKEESIIISKDITPSQTAQMDKNKVLGFVTETGGVTSHSAIIARTLGIPAILGVHNLLDKIKNGDVLIIDGNEGVVILNPDEKTLKNYREKIERYMEDKIELLKYKDLESITLDFKKVEVAGNIGSVEEVDSIIENGGEGIGLFRTEFLYMEKEVLPNEEEQFLAYKSVVEKLNGKPVVIRTLDIGGDKKLSYLPIKEELNPFLGYRAIRLCLDRKDIFKTQLRALLRASKYGNLKIMFPMICNLEELLESKKILKECKNELKEEGLEYDENLEVGIMIEVPSAAIISDILAKEVDFFSIGTNDLIQYTMAVDRMNEKVSYLYDFNNLAVLRLIKLVIENGHREGIWVGMCGEMAGREDLIPLLLGMGLEEFSMSPSSILKVRKIIRNLSFKESSKIVKKL